ncbi:hypothetical protein [Natrarchaeobius chitinivorans]|uniref:Uncharacterized protein n=1 Tax=Natrarchaeobius chitinivorans TaxID=1679083 RepID=A0A3N6P5K1_NATCH|nr:hypothetical protein [Natrarchaeobius chitinivorans]RQG90885.1 hypothetical protein EA473_20030 [Natrarchaeobius chitinivorans]
MVGGRHSVPEDQSVSEGTIALVIQQSGQYLWEFETPAPWEEAEWVLKKEYDHTEAPSSLDLQQAQIKQQVNDEGLEAVTLYVDKIRASMTDETNDSGDDQIKERANGGRRRGYLIRFSDETEIPDRGESHSSQKENMGKAVDYLIEEYNLTSVIDIPYRDGSTGRTSLINDEPKITDDQEMQEPYELVDENYLQTLMGGTEKKHCMKELAHEVDLEVWFGGDWTD